MLNIRELLENEIESGYQKFNSNIVRTSQPLLGVRMPFLRSVAKQIVKDDEWQEFLNQKPIHDQDNEHGEIYELTMIRALVVASVAKSQTFEWLQAQLASFVPTIENWAICDCFSAELKVTKKYRAEMIEPLERYLDSGREFEVRFGVVMLMNYYLEDEYIDYTLAKLTTIECSDYYVMMGVAWALSFAYIKYPEKTEPLLTTHRLTKETHNKTISKICDSYRVTADVKERLRGLRIKKS